jgi:hypothetical protein
MGLLKKSAFILCIGYSSFKGLKRRGYTMKKGTNLKIELKTEEPIGTGKERTIAVLTGTSADVVRRVMAKVKIAIAREEKIISKIDKEQVGDDFVSKTTVWKWEDPGIPDGFSHSKTILLIFKEMEAKGIKTKDKKIKYMTERIMELRQQARSR